MAFTVLYKYKDSNPVLLTNVAFYPSLTREILEFLKFTLQQNTEGSLHLSHFTNFSTYFFNFFLFNIFNTQDGLMVAYDSIREYIFFIIYFIVLKDL